MRKVFGFTLAEVLITLGIIGVVAAITIPSLIQRTQDAELKNMWKKEFSAINQAYMMVKQDEGGDISSHFDPTKSYYGASEIFPLLNEYLAPINDCGSTAWVCGKASINLTLNSTYKDLSGAYLDYNNLTYYQELLKDGANIYSRQYMNANEIIWVDVNGINKGPNTLGKDLYGLLMNANKIMPMGAPGTGVLNSCSSNTLTCPGSPFHPAGGCAGAGCSAEILMGN